MNLGVLIPIVAILATAWVMVTAMRMRQRRSDDGEDSAERSRLARENEELRRVITRIEERIGVLERIATDPAERTSREIDELR